MTYVLRHRSALTDPLTRDLIRAAIAHLDVLLAQATDRDDQILIAHARSAAEILRRIGAEKRDEK